MECVNPRGADFSVVLRRPFISGDALTNSTIMFASPAVFGFPSSRACASLAPVMLEKWAIAVRKPLSSAKSPEMISVSLRSFAKSSIERRDSGVVVRGRLRIDIVEEL